MERFLSNFRDHPRRNDNFESLEQLQNLPVTIAVVVPGSSADTPAFMGGPLAGVYMTGTINKVTREGLIFTSDTEDKQRFYSWSAILSVESAD